MFARFKGLNGENVAVVPYKVVSVIETKINRQVDDNAPVETKDATSIIMDGGITVYVSDSERAVRSRIEKVMRGAGLIGGSAASSGTNEGDDSGEDAPVEAPAEA